MAQPEILSEKPMNIVQLKEELERIKKRDKELNYRANKSLDYLNIFSQIDVKKAEELYDKISKLNIPRLRDIHIHKVIDIMPKRVEDLKLILQAYTITVTQDNMKKIVDAVAKYLPKKELM